MKCLECGANLKVDHRNHRYIESGLDDVVLIGVEVRTCPGCDDHEVVIPDMHGLHRVLALALSKKEKRLAPTEIRFVRKYLGLSGIDFSKAMGVEPETVSRWENGKTLMEAPSERLLRLMVCNMRPVEYYPIEQLAEVAKGEKQVPMKLKAKTSIGNKWIAEARA